MNKKSFLESGLLELYVLGLCTERQREEVEEMLKNHPDLKPQMKDMQRCMQQHAEKYTIPSSRLQNSPYTIPNKPGEKSHNTTKRNWITIVAAGVAILALSSATYLFIDNNHLVAENHELRKAYNQLSSTFNAVETKSVRLNQYYHFVQDPATQHVYLSGTAIAPEAKGMVYWNQEKRTAYFHALNLPDLEDESQFQIWADVKGEMISLGTLNSTDSMQHIQFVNQAASLNITIEPRGGSKTPSVDKLIMNTAV